MAFDVYVLSLPVSQFKSIKKAVRVLVNAGMPVDEACTFIVSKHQDNAMRRSQYHADREFSSVRKLS